MTNTVEDDLLNTSWDVLEMSVDGGTPSIDGVRSHVHRQLERLQLHRQGWQSQEQKDYQDKGSGSQSIGISRIHPTRHHGVRFGQPHPNGASVFFGDVKGCLRNPEADLELAVFLSCLRIAVLGRPPLPKEARGIIVIIPVGGVR